MRLTSPLAGLNAVVLVGAILAVGPLRPDDPARLAQAAPPAQERPASTAAAPPSPSFSPSPDPVVAPPAPARAPAPATAPSPPRPAATAATSPPAPAPARVARTAVRTGWGPYATVGPVTLHYPGDVVEVVGLHQSAHDGALPQSPAGGPARMGRLDSRSRDTHPQGAADIVVDPRREVRAPVTGTVLRAGSYTLYCDNVDDYVVIEPDAQPGWEVKMLHFEGVSVRPGQRVQAGVTVVGARARVLPFASQVDKHTASPSWPHLHLEVVDTSVPDRPSGGSC